MTSPARAGIRSAASAPTPTSLTWAAARSTSTASSHRRRSTPPPTTRPRSATPSPPSTATSTPAPSRSASATSTTSMTPTTTPTPRPLRRRGHRLLRSGASLREPHRRQRRDRQPAPRRQPTTIRLHIDSSAGEFTGSDKTFAATAFPVSTAAATAINHTVATLNGNFDPGRLRPHRHRLPLRLGNDHRLLRRHHPLRPAATPISAASRAHRRPPRPHPGPDLPLPPAPHAPPRRACSPAPIKSFTATAFPLATDAATAIDQTQATLNGHFDPQGDSGVFVTNCHFDYVTDADYNGAAPDPYASGGTDPLLPGAVLQRRRLGQRPPHRPHPRHHLPLPPPRQHRDAPASSPAPTGPSPPTRWRSPTPPPTSTTPTSS